MKKTLIYYLLGFLTPIILALILSFIVDFIFPIVRDKGDFKVFTTVSSPDGNHIATFWNGMGGGAAGWCRNHVSITEKNEEFNINNVEQNRITSVFDARCNSSVEILWKNENELKISFTLDSDGTSALMHSATKDKQIKVSYEPK